MESMRRPLLVTALLAVSVALAVTAVTVAGESPPADTPADTPAAAPQRAESAFVRATQREVSGAAAPRRVGHRHGRHRKVLRSLANRLEVTPAELKTALHAIKRDGADLKELWRKKDLVTLKQELATRLGTSLDRTPEETLSAVRAELESELDRAADHGVLTKRARELALGCFDEPADCNLRALRWEIGLGAFRHHRR